MVCKVWKRTGFILLGTVLLVAVGYVAVTHLNMNPNLERGVAVDSLDGVYVYYNGGVSQSSGRNTIDGYNVGIRYQCVEFVKRYYYLHYHHRMPYTYGNAKDFFNKSLASGQMNTDRALVQYKNGDSSKPQKGDLIVFDSYILNPYGHVAIISDVRDNGIEIVQQNPGPFGKSRVYLDMERKGANWLVKNSRVLGWLRK